MKKMPRRHGTFMKGALRYKRLDDNVRGLGSPKNQIRRWFIATTGQLASGGSRASGDLLFRANAAAFGLVFAEESIVAVTDAEVIVAELAGPGIFGASLDAEQITRGPIGSIEARFDPATEVVEIDGNPLNIFMFHEYDALQVLHLMGAELPAWFVPA